MSMFFFSYFYSLYLWLFVFSMHNFFLGFRHLSYFFFFVIMLDTWANSFELIQTRSSDSQVDSTNIFVRFLFCITSSSMPIGYQPDEGHCCGRELDRSTDEPSQFRAVVVPDQKQTNRFLFFFFLMRRCDGRRMMNILIHNILMIEMGEREEWEEEVHPFQSCSLFFFFFLSFYFP